MKINAMKILQTAERVSDTDQSDKYVFQRSLLAYVKSAEIVKGDVLEIGTGNGYGIEIIAPQTKSLLSVDKFQIDNETSAIIQNLENVEFKKMKTPPLKEIPDKSMDYVVSFQVIEHIKNDDFFVSEVYRVLKNGGKFIVTTPNKKMSLTRSPWHIREYTVNELEDLLLKSFQSVNKQGVFGNKKIMEYYEKN